MNAAHKIAVGTATVVGLAMLAFAPTRADTHERLATVGTASMAQVAVLNSPETPQELTWDMSLESSPPQAISETAPAPATEDVSTDMSLG